MIKSQLVVSAFLILSGLSICCAQTATTLLWDPTNNQIDGAGTWNTTNSNWFNGTADQVFVNGSTNIKITLPATGGTNITATVTAGTPFANESLVNSALGPNTTFGAFTTVTSFSSPTVTLAQTNGTGTPTVIGGYNVAFGASSTGTGGLVTLSTAMIVANMTINSTSGGAYSFGGASLEVGGQLTLNNSVTFNNVITDGNQSASSIIFNGPSLSLNLTGGSTFLFGNGGAYGTVTNAGGATINLNTFGGTTNPTESYTSGGGGIDIGNIASGTGGLQINQGATFNLGSGVNVGDGRITTGTTGLATVGQSGLISVNSGGILSGENGTGFNVARNGGSGELIINTGGTAQIENTGTSTQNIDIVFAGGTGVIDVKGGSYDSGTTVFLNQQGAGTATFQVDSGSAVLPGLILNAAQTYTNGAAGAGTGTLDTAGTSTFQLNGGAVFLGGAGPTTTAAQGTVQAKQYVGLRNDGGAGAHYAVNLTGGILGAAASWTSSLNVTLSNTGTGANGATGVTFEADNGGPSVMGTGAVLTSFNIGLSGVLSGTGNLTKTGGGTLTLSGGNTYTGTTSINGGEINLGIADNGTTGPLGKGGTINFGGGVLQYSPVNQTDYSNRFATTGAQQFDIDLNGQTITYNTALTGGAGSPFTLNDSAPTTSNSLTLNATPTYTGTTTINSGRLIVTPGTLNATSQVVINGGSLLFGAGNTGTIGSSATPANVNLNSGTIGFTTHNSTTGSSLTAGALTLASSGAAIINFGTSVASSVSNILTFSSLGNLSSSSTISVYDYSVGDLNLNGGVINDISGTNDHLLFNISTGIGSTGTNEINFYSDNGTTLIGQGYEVMYGSQYKIVPLAVAVPESSTFLMAVGVMTLLYAKRLRSIFAKSKQE